MILGDTMAFLCISLNSSSVDTIHLMDGELHDIDKYTIECSGAKEILNNFPDKIEELKNIYNLEGDTSSIRVRIFLPNDKEQIVLYSRHLIVFKIIIKDRKFLQYVVNYEPNLFDKEIKKIVLNDQLPDEYIAKSISSYISELSDDDYLDMLRKICNEYINYIEDEPDEQLPTMDEIYASYLEKTSSNINLKVSLSTQREKQTKKSAFAVFEHPNFFKKYGHAIDTDKPIFLLGAKIDDESKIEYKDINDNLKKCFKNKIYSPFNIDIACPITDEFKQVVSNSLLLVVNANGCNENLFSKIEYASYEGIAVIILVSDIQMKNIYTQHFGDDDNILIMDYKINDYASKCEFARIMTGIYIKKYNELKQKVG